MSYHLGMRLALLAVLACGCPGAKTPTVKVTVPDVLDHLAKARSELTSFVADTTMDYWLGNQRAKGEVIVMGKPGAFVRFAALSPAGGSTMAEMACDGTNFVLVDFQNNCMRSGPCDQTSIAQFFRIDLAPDDFLHLALGTPPVIANATGTVTWDGDKGVNRVELHGDGGTEKLAINDHWDVVEAELAGADGRIKWSVANTDFTDVDGHRVPGKSRFKSPGNQEDLLVDWGDTSNRKVNPTLDNSKFQLQPPAGLAHCP